jgi:hypothetical protein
MKNDGFENALRTTGYLEGYIHPLTFIWMSNMIFNHFGIRTERLTHEQIGRLFEVRPFPLNFNFDLLPAGILVGGPIMVSLCQLLARSFPYSNQCESLLGKWINPGTGFFELNTNSLGFRDSNSGSRNCERVRRSSGGIRRIQRCVQTTLVRADFLAIEMKRETPRLIRVQIDLPRTQEFEDSSLQRTSWGETVTRIWALENGMERPLSAAEVHFYQFEVPNHAENKEHPLYLRATVPFDSGFVALGPIQ